MSGRRDNGAGRNLLRDGNKGARGVRSGMSRPKLASTLAGFGIAAAIVALVIAAAFLAPRAIPDDATSGTAQAIETPTMLVSEGDLGEVDDGDGSEDEQDDQEPDDQPEQRDERARVEAPIVQVANPNAPATIPGNAEPVNQPSRDSRQPGSQTTPQDPGNRTNPQNPSVERPDSPKPDRPGSREVNLATNLGDFSVVTATTPAPDPTSITLRGRSGLDHDTGRLAFAAYPTGRDANSYDVEVSYQGDSTGGAWTPLPSRGASEPQMYDLPITLVNDSVTSVKMVLRDRETGAQLHDDYDFAVRYRGRQGPDITFHNVDDGQVIVTENFSARISAVDHETGASIFTDNLKVTITGPDRTVKKLDAATGSPPFDFDIKFTDFVLEGEDSTFVITATAEDYTVEHVTTSASRTVVYRHASEGAVVGTAKVIVDATSVGLGVIADFEIELHQGRPFPEDLEIGLMSAGLTADHDGTPAMNYFLTGLRSGGRFSGSGLDAELMHKVEQDKINYNGSRSDDVLAQFQFTAESGWMYSVNGGGFGSRNLSEFRASPGDVVTLYFSVNNAKDAGYTGGPGALSSYCGSWVGGYYTPAHNLANYVVTREPTCLESGEAFYVCTVEGCGARGSHQGTEADGIAIDLGLGDHRWGANPIEFEEPGPDNDYVGYNIFKCEVCGEERVDPWYGEKPEEPEEPDPDTGGGDGDEGGGTQGDSGSGGIGTQLTQAALRVMSQAAGAVR